MTERTTEPTNAPSGDEEGFEGGKTAPGEATGTHGQLDAASGGYGSQSGTASSGGTGDGEAGAGGDAARGEPGTSSSPTGATDAGPTEWLRRA